ncbi:MAG: hypothetical protein M3Z22_08660 [Verrucomicrobiota bacterium]|nr:hypothetical protein [Verrucomicrobiota bacterium]
MFHCLCFLALLGSSISIIPNPEQTIDRKKLVGEWRYEDEQTHVRVTYVFSEDGTFTSELWRDGEVTRKLEGLWSIVDGDMLVYSFMKDSREQAPIGGQDRDHILHLDESSFTIGAADNARRTYFRVMPVP